MNDTTRTPDDRAITAMAAAWLARLHSDDRTAQDDAAFRIWLDENDRHATAFAHMTAVWEVAGGTGDNRVAVAVSDQAHSRRTFIAAAMAFAITGVGAGAWLANAPQTYATAIGEQRRVTLADGSTVVLDTNSRIRVQLGPQYRKIDMLNGRAHFAVAKDPLKPFVVRAGEQQVIALGTAFDVDHDDEDVSVLLVEGRVAVRSTVAFSAGQDRIMTPGDRLMFRQAQLILHDRPDLTAMTSWQSGRLIFAQEPLANVVKLLNRYSKKHLVIADPALAQVQISGVYDANNPEGFARSAALLLPIRVEIGDGEIILRLMPALS